MNLDIENNIVSHDEAQRIKSQSKEAKYNLNVMAFPQFDEVSNMRLNLMSQRHLSNNAYESFVQMKLKQRQLQIKKQKEEDKKKRKAKMLNDLNSKINESNSDSSSRSRHDEDELGR